MVKARHLGAAARGVLDLPAAERIDHIRRPRWIGYTWAKQLLGKRHRTSLGHGATVKRHLLGSVALLRAKVVAVRVQQPIGS